MRYSKSAIALALVAAVLWSGAIALLIGQVSNQVLRPFATTAFIVAATITVVLVLDRVAARLTARDTRPPIIVHADWNMDLASRTTITNGPRRVVSIPVPVLHIGSGDGDTTLSIRRGATQLDEMTVTTGDASYDRAFTDISNGLIVGRDDDPWAD